MTPGPSHATARYTLWKAVGFSVFSNISDRSSLDAKAPSRFCGQSPGSYTLRPERQRLGGRHRFRLRRARRRGVSRARARPSLNAHPGLRGGGKGRPRPCGSTDTGQRPRARHRAGPTEHPQREPQPPRRSQLTSERMATHDKQTW